jgi:hypothetical protein
MPGQRERNTHLEAAVREAGWSYAQLAAEIRRLAARTGAEAFLRVGPTHVGKWVTGTVPSGAAPELIAEVLSRHLGRHLTPGHLGWPDPASDAARVDWDIDSLALIALLAEIVRSDTDMDRRQFAFSVAAYTAAAATVPTDAWWKAAAKLRQGPEPAGSRKVGRGDVQAVTDMVALFQRADQQWGGGNARAAVISYLSNDVSGLLRGRFADESVRRALFSAASELAYLVGFMCFDDHQHGLAQRYFMLSVKLAAEADDPPMAAHVMRALAHQALDVGRPDDALAFAAASIEGDRFRLTTPRERSLNTVVHARALAAGGARTQAVSAISRAALELDHAGEDRAEDPGRIFFYGAASLARQTGLTLAALGDKPGAEAQLRRAAHKRPQASFTRSHALTLAELGGIQIHSGALEAGCASYTTALEAMDGIRSARTRKAALEMRSALSPFSARRIRLVAEVDERAAAYLAAAR